jgi:arabinogalactan endo-1,4-beta-galactosidase
MRYLNDNGVMPKYVQIGNEINCGMLYTDASVNFPNCEVCDDESWANLGTVINAGIKGVRDVSEEAGVETEVILHIADPQHVTWWFDNIKLLGKVTDFDIIGFSYYPLWHTEVKLSQLAITVSGFRAKYAKEVMMVETAYPWTMNAGDGYANIFGTETPLTGFPFARKGQLDLLVAMSQEMMYAGGLGLIYWEPAWITSNMQTMYGTGSAWENCALFDYNGEVANLAWFTDYPYN